MVTAECHAHIFMDGVDYKKAAAAHENGPREDLIREHLAAYQKAGISYVRDGGDPYGAGVLARSLAPEYGITYRTPVFAIHRAGRYGKIVGRAFSDGKEYCALVREVRRAGGDFIKIIRERCPPLWKKPKTRRCIALRQANAEGRQKIIVELYNTFFKVAMPKTVEKLGIVYTKSTVIPFFSPEIAIGSS